MISTEREYGDQAYIEEERPTSLRVELPPSVVKDVERLYEKLKTGLPYGLEDLDGLHEMLDRIRGQQLHREVFVDGPELVFGRTKAEHIQIIPAWLPDSKDHWVWKGTFHNDQPFGSIEGRTIPLRKWVLEKQKLIDVPKNARIQTTCGIIGCLQPEHMYIEYHQEHYWAHPAAAPLFEMSIEARLEKIKESPRAVSPTDHQEIFAFAHLQRKQPRVGYYELEEYLARRAQAAENLIQTEPYVPLGSGHQDHRQQADRALRRFAVPTERIPPEYLPPEEVAPGIEAASVEEQIPLYNELLDRAYTGLLDLEELLLELNA